jgi:glucose/mannose-6-phosphate isomerase
MEESIKNFSQQFKFEPEIIGQFNVINKKTYVLAGMGGSHLAGGIFTMLNPEINLIIHKNYDLPKNILDKGQTLFLAFSHSGNTEEVIDFADEVYSEGNDLIIVTTGGKLLDFAKQNNLPHILIPDTAIQPRTATGYFLLALYKIILPDLVSDLKNMGQNILPEKQIEQAVVLSDTLKNKTPIIYCSQQNQPLAYNWKIKFNETAKIPSFINFFPELNHNEMQGFDFVKSNYELSSKFHFIFLYDTEDDLNIEKRMKNTEQILQEKGFSVTSLYLSGSNKIEKIFNSVILADFLTLSLSKYYEVDPEQVPLIEKFKKTL